MQLSSLTDLQLAVMTALWSVEEGTVSDVHGAMRDDGRELAVTTVATLLHRLSKQGWVLHRKVGRQLVYRAKVRRDEAAQGALRRVLSTFFGGRASLLTAQLLDSEDLSPDELAELRELLREKQG